MLKKSLSSGDSRCSDGFWLEHSWLRNLDSGICPQCEGGSIAAIRHITRREDRYAMIKFPVALIASHPFLHDTFMPIRRPLLRYLEF